MPSQFHWSLSSDPFHCLTATHAADAIGVEQNIDTASASRYVTRAAIGTIGAADSYPESPTRRPGGAERAPERTTNDEAVLGSCVNV